MSSHLVSLVRLCLSAVPGPIKSFGGFTLSGVGSSQPAIRFQIECHLGTNDYYRLQEFAFLTLFCLYPQISKVFLLGLFPFHFPDFVIQLFVFLHHAVSLMSLLLPRSLLLLALAPLASHWQPERTLNHCKHARCRSAQTSDRVQRRVIEALRAPPR